MFEQNDEALRERAVWRLVEAAAQVLENSIGSIYAVPETGKPTLVGSCLFVTLGTEEFVLTSTHVLRDAGNNALHVCKHGYASPLSEPFATVASGDFLGTKDVIDIAFCRLTRATKSRLKALRPFRLDGAIFDEDATWNRCFAVLGFPYSRSKKPTGRPTVTIPQPGLFHMQAASGQRVAGEPLVSTSAHIVLHWNPRVALKAPSQRVNAPHLKGCSGGPLFDLGDLDDPLVLQGAVNPPPRLAGVFTRWFSAENLAVASRIGMLPTYVSETRGLLALQS